MKTPLVLLSGLLSNQRLWRHQIAHLADIASIQVISSTQNTPEKMVRSILDQAPAKFSLAGHSMGGWLCLEVMRVAPSRVNRLCLLNTTARMDTEDKAKKRHEMIQRVQKGQFPQVAKEIVDHFVFNASVKSEVEKMFLEVGSEAFIHQQQAMLERKECLSLLPSIRCPTWVIHALRDENFSLEEHQELVDQIHNGELRTVEDSGHMSPMEAPQAITALLRAWLKL